jgi:hypothetical protein
LRKGAIETRQKIDSDYSLKAVSIIWDRAFDIVYAKNNPP